MIILGIDPGTANTGYGLVRKGRKKKIKCLNWGVIETSPSLSDGERLRRLNNELNKLIRKYKPKILAVENVYFFKNLKTALPVSQAKGVILLTAAKKKIPVYEFTPLQIKMAIVGYGRAEKTQIQKMIKMLLGLKEIPKPDDAADALAVAVCCAISLRWYLPTLNLMKKRVDNQFCLSIIDARTKYSLLLRDRGRMLKGRGKPANWVEYFFCSNPSRKPGRIKTMIYDEILTSFLSEEEEWETSEEELEEAPEEVSEEVEEEWEAPEQEPLEGIPEEEEEENGN